MITATLDPKDEQRLRNALQKLAELSDQPVKDVLRQQGRLFAVDAARFTGRVGNTAAAGRQHKKDVRSTIEFIYMRPLKVAKMISNKAGERTGRKFSNYIRRREISKAQFLVDRFLDGGGYSISVGMWDGGELHKKRLTKAGYKQRLIVVDYRNVTQFIREKVKRVGALKAGWAKAAEQLGGTRGIPAYAKKGHTTLGLGHVGGYGSQATLEVSNKSPYALQNTSLGKLWKLRAKNIEKVVERMIAREGKRIARRV